MNLRRTLPALTLLASACTISPQGGSVNTEIHPPFTTQSWQLDNYTLKDGGHACAISTGYNGLTVYVREHPEGEEVSVESNRRMEPGDTLTVTAGGNTFQTYNSFFPRKTSQTMLALFAKGGSVYMEWSVLGGAQAGQRVNIQNGASLDGFNSRLQECRSSLGATTHP